MDIDSSPGFSPSEMDLFELCESSQEDAEDTALTEEGFLKVQQAAYTVLYCVFVQLWAPEGRV